MTERGRILRNLMNFAQILLSPMTNFTFLTIKQHRGDGQVVSVLASYADDASSNPTKAYSFFLQNLSLKRPKIIKNKQHNKLRHDCQH